MNTGFNMGFGVFWGPHQASVDAAEAVEQNPITDESAENITDHTASPVTDGTEVE